MKIQNTKKISVLVPCWNNAETCEKCLNSIISQNYKNIEIIWCDDCSDDGSYEIVKEIKAKQEIKNLKLIRNDSNKGISTTRNLLLQEYTGDAFIFVDSDDFFYSPKAISTLFNASNDLEYDVVLGKHIMSYPTRKTTTPLLKWWWNLGNKESTSFKNLSNKVNTFFWWNNLFSREFQKKYEDLIPKKKKGPTMDEEWQLFVLLSLAKKIRSINKITYQYNYSQSSSCFHKQISKEKFESSIQNMKDAIENFNKYKNDITIQNQKIFYSWTYFLNDIFFYRLRASHETISRELSKELFWKHLAVVKTGSKKRIFFYKWWKNFVFITMKVRQIFWI